MFWIKKKKPAVLPMWKRFGLGIGGVLTENNHDPFDSIQMSYGARSCQACLSQWWGVQSREDLLNMISWLGDEGHRKDWNKWATVLGLSISQTSSGQPLELSEHEKFLINNLPMIQRLQFQAWDLGRLVNLARWGFGSKYISEDEAWNSILNAAVVIQRNYSSWKDVGDDFILGYKFWSLDKDSMPDITDAYDRLMNGSQSPWRTVPWDTTLPGSL